MTTATTYGDLFDLIDLKWEARWMGTLAIDGAYREAGDQDQELSIILSQIITYVREQTMDADGNVYTDQVDENGKTIDTISDDEMARRIVDAFSVLLNG